MRMRPPPATTHAAEPSSSASGSSASGSRPALHLHRWTSKPMLGVALIMVAVGFTQFSPAAVLGDVADHFGQRGPGDSIAEQAGLSGTALGIGLALIRVASLGALAFAVFADRRGRRRTALGCSAVGIAVTASAAGAPGYWWFVAALALARPLLTAANTVCQVLAAEYTSAQDRAKALAVTSAAYGLGAGLVVVLRAAAGDALSFRGVFAAAALAWVAVGVASRVLVEPDRYTRSAAAQLAPGALGVFAGARRRRLAAMVGLVVGAAMITGPANTLLFVYAENVLDASSTLTATLVVAAAPIGLAGLFVGRVLADRLGRRPTAGAGLVLLAVSATVAYSGSLPALGVGYLCGIFVGSTFATPAQAMATELFPTHLRASAVGWLVVSGVLGATGALLAVGALADLTDSFGTAMALVCLPAGLLAGLVVLVPETRGQELEQSAPEPTPAPPTHPGGSR